MKSNNEQNTQTVNSAPVLTGRSFTSGSFVNSVKEIRGKLIKNDPNRFKKNECPTGE
jgi:hypothetical protein